MYICQYFCKKKPGTFLQTILHNYSHFFTSGVVFGKKICFPSIRNERLLPELLEAYGQHKEWRGVWSAQEEAATYPTYPCMASDLLPQGNTHMHLTAPNV